MAKTYDQIIREQDDFVLDIQEEDEIATLLDPLPEPKDDEEVFAEYLLGNRE